MQVAFVGGSATAVSWGAGGRAPTGPTGADTVSVHRLAVVAVISVGNRSGRAPREAATKRRAVAAWSPIAASSGSVLAGQSFMLTVTRVR